MRLHKVAAFFVRDLLWDLSYPLNFFWRGASIFFSLVTFYFLGRLVVGGTSGHLAAYGEGGYFPFVLVGLALAGFQNVALNSISSAVQYGMYTGTLEAMLVTPTSISTIVFSSVLYQFVSSLLNILLYLAFGAVLFGFPLGQADFLSAVVMLVLTLLAHLPLGILSASFLLIFKRGDPITSLVGHLSAVQVTDLALAPIFQRIVFQIFANKRDKRLHLCRSDIGSNHDLKFFKQRMPSPCAN